MTKETNKFKYAGFILKEIVWYHDTENLIWLKSVGLSGSVGNK